MQIVILSSTLVIVAFDVRVLGAAELALLEVEVEAVPIWGDAAGQRGETDGSSSE